MAKWVTKELEELLKKLNEVPLTDKREAQQLTILMKAFADLNSSAMNKIAKRTRSTFRGWSLDDVSSLDIDPVDTAAEERTKLRPIR